MNFTNISVEENSSENSVQNKENKADQVYDSIQRFFMRGELPDDTYRIIKGNPLASYVFFQTIDNLNLSSSKIHPINQVREEDWIKLIKIFKKEPLFQHYVRETLTGASAVPHMKHRSEVEKITQNAMGKTGILSGTLLFYANDLFAVCAAMTGFAGLLSSKPGAREKSTFDELVTRALSALKFAETMIKNGFTTLSNYIWMLNTREDSDLKNKSRIPSPRLQCMAVEAINQSLQETFL